MSDGEAQAVAARAVPVTGAERMPALDTLRGVAVLGILVMNIYYFAMPLVAYSNPLAMGGTELHNLGTWFFTHVFFDLKFLSIFAMLFGAGLVLMWERAEARGARFGRVYFRRQFWLLLIGALHGYLLWAGDILFGYALVGMAVYPLRRLQARTLIIVACVLVCVTAAAMHSLSYTMEQMRDRAAGYAELQAAGQALDDKQRRTLEEWHAMRPFVAPTDEDKQAELAAHLGSYAELMDHRVPATAGMQQGFLFMYSWRIAGLMCLGMAMIKLGVLTAIRSEGFYRRLMLMGYGLGLPLTVYSGLDQFAHEFESIYFMRYGMLANYFGSIVVALGHIGMVMLVVRTGYLRGLMRRFAAVGRMALTNYLLHSLILTTVFYGYGLGLYGRIPRFWQMGFVLAVMALQLLASSWWLARFRFGPAEWAWRSLTYWERQPMRRRAVA